MAVRVDCSGIAAAGFFWALAIHTCEPARQRAHALAQIVLLENLKMSEQAGIILLF